MKRLKPSVYDRLYNSRTVTKNKKKEEKKKSTVKPRNNSAKVTSSRSRATFSRTKWFSLDNRPSNSQFQKAKNRVPTPVAKEEEKALERSDNDYLSMSAKERISVYSSEQKLPNFGSENPSSKSHFSDQIEWQALTDIDDDVEDNLGDLLKSIQMQNDNLKSRIQAKRQGKIDLHATMNPNHELKVIGMPLEDFQTPDVRKLKTKTLDEDVLSPIKGNNLLQTNYVGESIFSNKTEEGDFEREDNEESLQKLNIFTSNKKSNTTLTVKNDENKGVTCWDCTLLKSWVTMMAAKVKQAQDTIKELESKREIDLLKYQTKIEGWEREK